jgi:hypothetical protein
VSEPTRATIEVRVEGLRHDRFRAWMVRSVHGVASLPRTTDTMEPYWPKFSSFLV